MKLSVIIPTYNRFPILQRAIDALARQYEHAPEFEVVVVDDGSSDETPAVIARLMPAVPFRLLYLQQPNRGPAAARNRGIEAASGQVVIFIGDDIIVQPNFLEQHYQTHLKHPQPHIAVMGPAIAHPELMITPLTQWWERWQFRYQLLQQGRRGPDFSFFYTCNVSVKREFLRRYGLFDEGFTEAIYEDTELGYRLTQHGLRIIFEPQAAAYHYHQLDLESIGRQMELRGRHYDRLVTKTGQLGLSQIWTWLGTGPWMQPWLIRPLWYLADRLQTSRLVTPLTPLFILVLMYSFQVGRGKRPPLR